MALLESQHLILNKMNLKLKIAFIPIYICICLRLSSQEINFDGYYIHLFKIEKDMVCNEEYLFTDYSLLFHLNDSLNSYVQNGKLVKFFNYTSFTFFSMNKPLPQSLRSNEEFDMNYSKSLRYIDLHYNNFQLFQLKSDSTIYFRLKKVNIEIEYHSDKIIYLSERCRFGIPTTTWALLKYSNIQRDIHYDEIYSILKIANKIDYFKARDFLLKTYD